MSPLAPPYLPYLLDFTNESNHNNTDVSWLTKHSSLFNINSLLLLFCSIVLYLRFISVYILMLSMLILWQFMTQSSFYSTQQILLRTAPPIKSAFIYMYYIHHRFSFSQNHYRKQLQTLHISSNSKQETVIHFLISSKFFSSLNSSYSHVKRQLHHAEIPTVIKERNPFIIVFCWIFQHTKLYTRRAVKIEVGAAQVRTGDLQCVRLTW